MKSQKIFKRNPNSSYNCGKRKARKIKTIPKIIKIEMRGLIKQVEIMPISAICLIEMAIMGMVKKVAPKDALMLSFNISGKNELKK